jgi:hypothetical protein
LCKFLAIAAITRKTCGVRFVKACNIFEDKFGSGT